MARLFFLSLSLAVLAAGCTSSAKARAKANAAFIAGQQEAWTQFQQAHPNSVRVVGPLVHQPTLEWTPTLTLSEAIVAAGYQGPNPRVIVVVRAGQAIPVEPKRLLGGEDMPLQAGDTVEIRP